MANLIRYCTRFTEDVFNAFLGTTYLHSATTAMWSRLVAATAAAAAGARHAASASSSALLSLVFGLLTFTAYEIAFGCLRLPSAAFDCLRLPSTAFDCLRLPSTASDCPRLPYLRLSPHLHREYEIAFKSPLRAPVRALPPPRHPQPEHSLCRAHACRCESSRAFASSRYFSRRVRSLVADFGPALAVGCVSLLSTSTFSAMLAEVPLMTTDERGRSLMATDERGRSLMTTACFA